MTTDETVNMHNNLHIFNKYTILYLSFIVFIDKFINNIWKIEIKNSIFYSIVTMFLCLFIIAKYYISVI